MRLTLDVYSGKETTREFQKVTYIKYFLNDNSIYTQTCDPRILLSSR